MALNFMQGKNEGHLNNNNNDVGKVISLTSAKFVSADFFNRKKVEPSDVNILRRRGNHLRSVFEGLIPPPNQCVTSYGNLASSVASRQKSMTQRDVFRCKFEPCRESFEEEHQLWYEMS
jgi:hypothetical protein